MNKPVKIKILTVLCILAMSLCSVPSSRGDELDAVGDVFLVRPGSFVATVVGSAVFVVALPFAAMSRSVKTTAQVLVIRPAQFTFTRPVGQFGDWTGD